MNKEKIVRTIGGLSFIFPAFLAWLADDFTPLFLDLENPILQIPKKLFLIYINNYQHYLFINFALLLEKSIF